ncbi:dihydrolipoyllysine-residue succinyltransferase [Geobacter pelophilus]|uniref:Dihydrolipoyllysine-residue succinyltransferase component of 2-oxoglutarate dehydrogenase complex n=1 Tax=Geoanaerobacter pelophilus TaxID=60036 RepID=A0AAW4L3E3_9BACT|nr:dihydrolipoyllysine-residue succinyltransferase [Geoanaerobacter pelophilus]MBT0663503.1 dihydrolipoyllysine-residue succinyltransferase [Geoanaerobacter pelophilus]
MEIKIPEVGESVHDALVAKWLKDDGSTVTKDEPLCEIETDKITLELNADASGVLTITIPAGQTVPVGTVIGSIAPGSAIGAQPQAIPPASPAARKLAAEKGVDAATLSGTGKGGRITPEDVMKAAVPGDETGSGPELLVVRSESPVPYTTHHEPPPSNLKPRTRRVAMTPIRRRIAERLLAVRQQTAMLTSFNEADLTRIIALRKGHGEHFREKHGVKLGFMSFFVKACCEGLKEFPAINAAIDGSDIVYHDYCNIGIAIGAEKGLVVPVLRDAERLHFSEIEQQIESFAVKVKENRLAIADLEGGTFSISNGGVYGSLLSTPILNPPQSGVLGMHAIQDRAVVRDGQVVIRPMMYLALSYDHRIVDGREAVGFLKRVKEYVEEPEELFLEG